MRQHHLFSIALCLFMFFGTFHSLAEPRVMEFQSATGEILALDMSDIDALTRRDVDRGIQLDIRLKPSAAKEFAQFTTRVRGEEVTLSLCGEIILRAIVMVPILDGLIAVNEIPIDQGQRLLPVLEGGQQCSF